MENKEEDEKMNREQKKVIIQYVLEAEKVGEAMDIDEFLAQVKAKEGRELEYSRSTKLRLNN